MSNEKTLSEEKERKVVITAEECYAALDFWKHFNIPIPPSFQTALDSFAANPSIENEDKVKLELCRAISTTDHEAFKDEMFSKIVEECASVTYDMEFDRDFEATVTKE